MHKCLALSSLAFGVESSQEHLFTCECCFLNLTASTRPSHDPSIVPSHYRRRLYNASVSPSYRSDVVAYAWEKRREKVGRNGGETEGEMQDEMQALRLGEGHAGRRCRSAQLWPGTFSSRKRASL